MKYKLIGKSIRAVKGRERTVYRKGDIIELDDRQAGIFSDRIVPVEDEGDLDQVTTAETIQPHECTVTVDDVAVEEVEVEHETKLATGECIGDLHLPEIVSEEEPLEEESPEEEAPSLDGVGVNVAFKKIRDCNDGEVLNAWLNDEKRKSVVRALKGRINAVNKTEA